MARSFDVIGRAREVLEIEAQGILKLKDRLGAEFSRAVDLLFACEGKVVVTGLGKSGQIGRKIAATLASTGTPAFFLHAAEGLHGDLGMIARHDSVLAVSNSGETEEVLKLVPMIKRWGLPLVVITGSARSTLARAGDAVLDVEVPEEACPLGLSPTTSTTATLAMGDALAVVLLEKRGFQEEDFLVRHPGGTLGRRLLLRTSDLMHRGEAVPLVSRETALRDALLEISSKRLGVTGVTGAAGELVGVITDGDLRRALTRRDGNILALEAGDIMTRNPKTIPANALAAEAVAIMERFAITSLFIVDPEGHRPEGIIHLHDLLRAGIV